MASLLVGVDGGGTKARAAVARTAATVLARAEGGAANASTYSTAKVVRSVCEAIDGALAQCSASRGDLRCVVAGLAGAADPAVRAGIADALRDALGIGSVSVETDARVALAGAHATDPEAAGILLIAGTGSIAYGRNGAGAEARAGGLGWILGDEGSGFWIARRGLAAAGRAWDGRGPATKICDLLEVRGVRDASTLVAFTHSSGVLPSGVAAHFPIVLEAARSGDAVALDILREAAEQLARLAELVVRKLALPTREEISVTITGGIFGSAGALLVEPLLSSFERLAVRARVAPPAVSPEEGALRLAERRNP